MDSLVAVVLEMIFGYAGAVLLHFYKRKTVKVTLKENPFLSIAIGFFLIAILCFSAYLLTRVIDLTY